MRDDFGDVVRAGSPPSRIVSLNPTTTELLFAIGKGSRVVGRTHWDLWPDSARAVPDMGPGLRPNVEAVLATHPDLVILYASQDNRAAASRLRSAGINTLALRIDSIGDFRRAVSLLGAVTGDPARASLVRDSVMRTLERIQRRNSAGSRPTVFWHVWDAPIITIGRGSFMSELVEIAGGRNVYADVKQPSPAVSIEDISRRNPDYILAGPIGAVAIRRDPKWKIVAAAREGRILVIDTALVARPSVQLGEAAASLARLLHPEANR